MKNFGLSAALLLLAATLMGTTGCSKKGPAEKLGEKIDGTKDPIHDALEPDGIGEKAGKKIDKAGRNIDNSVDKAGNKIDRSIDRATH